MIICLLIKLYLMEVTIIDRRKPYFLYESTPGTIQYHLQHLYDLMFEYFGDRKWWPAETVEEVIIGAILVQSVSWKNTEKAIGRLRDSNLLTFSAIHHAHIDTIASCITSTLYYKMKAKKLKAFAAHLAVHHHGRLSDLFDQPMNSLRTELLSIYGIGPETADDIVLYAAEMPSFVVDAYTKRIFSRLGIVRADIPYEVLRTWFMEHLPNETALFNQYHALLDGLGHYFCSNQKPRCEPCPLRPVCTYTHATRTRPAED